MGLVVVVNCVVLWFGVGCLVVLMVGCCSVLCDCFGLLIVSHGLAAVQVYGSDVGWSLLGLLRL